jgi:hypothetical protein
MEEQSRRRRKIATEARVLWFISIAVTVAFAVGLGSVIAWGFQTIFEMPLFSFGLFCLAAGIFSFFGYVYLPRAAEALPGSWVSLTSQRRLSRREIELERARIELQREEARTAHEEAAAACAREEAARRAEAAERERMRAEGKASAARQQIRNQRKALLNTMAILDEKAGMLREWRSSGQRLFDLVGHERGTWAQDREVLVQDGLYDEVVRTTDSAFHALVRVPRDQGPVSTALIAQAQLAIATALAELQARLNYLAAA